MRVIAGSAGGIHLDAPKTGLRPTMDQVKGAIFSSLADLVVEATVLDLFSGTGGLGIEALSRGATHATLVELDRKAVECIRTNLAKTHLEAEVFAGDVYRFLDLAIKKERKFDIIFADPPYSHAEDSMDHAKRLFKNEYLPMLLKDDGIFVLEKIPKTDLPLSAAWRITREKRYGNTELVFLARV